MQLEVVSEMQMLDSKPRFNSILVQLEVAALAARGSGVVFQFHIGAIRSGLPWDEMDAVFMFQFHIGAIRR